MTDKHQLSKDNFSQFIHFDKYARYLPELKRRESFEETVTRNMDMHIKKFPQLEKDIRDAYKLVYDKRVLPSMRSMQFAGPAIERNPARLYNCCFLHVDHLDAFSEACFLLLSGTGVGYSVQKHHVEKLPPIMGPKQLGEKEKPKRYLIGDSIEGWSDAIKVLLESFFLGKAPIDFDFSDIREKGAQLVTSGGKAPGPDPLRFALSEIFNLLKRAIDKRGRGTQLKSIEAHDILCHIADAVLSGGIRRAAMISLFSFDDTDMLYAKSNFTIESWDHLYEDGPLGVTGESQKVIQIHIDNKGAKFYDLSVTYKDPAEGTKTQNIYWVSEENFEILKGIQADSKFINGDMWKYQILAKKKGTLPWYHFQGQRGRANNSIVLVRDKIQKEEFDSIWHAIEDSMAGEPGFFFTSDSEWGLNPCVSGSTIVEATVDGKYLKTSIRELAEYVDSLEEPAHVEVKTMDPKTREVKFSEMTSLALTKRNTEVLKITDEDTGKTITCTPDHKIFTLNRGWVEAKDLTESDQLKIL